MSTVQAGSQAGFTYPASQPRLNPASRSGGVRRGRRGSIRTVTPPKPAAAYKAAGEAGSVSRPLQERSNDWARAVRAVGVRPARALMVVVAAALLAACGQGGGADPASTSPVDADNAAIERMVALSEEAPEEFERNARTVCSVLEARSLTFDAYMTKDASHPEIYYWALLGVSERCPELMGDL